MKMKNAWQKGGADSTTVQNHAEDEDPGAKVLNSLSAEQKQVVELRVFEEKSFKEMAQTTGKSEVALRKIYERARQKMRAFWNGEDA
jgi:RNA polymerase sigma-70 factor (ECF subfamily)